MGPTPRTLPRPLCKAGRWKAQRGGCLHRRHSMRCEARLASSVDCLGSHAVLQA